MIKVILVVLVIWILFVFAGANIYGVDKMMKFYENPCSVPEMRIWLEQTEKIRCAQVDALREPRSQA